MCSEEGVYCAQERVECYVKGKGFWLASFEGKKPVERPGRGMEVNIEMGLKIIGQICTGFIRLKTGSRVGLL